MNNWGLISPLPLHEWWRLWTCHLAHWSWQHMLLNLIAAVPPLFLMPSGRRWRLILWATVSAPLVSSAILAAGFHGEYRGASGVIVGMWAYSGVTLARESNSRGGSLLLGFLAVKLTLEAAGAWPAASSDFETIGIAHYAGALVGATAACVPVVEESIYALRQKGTNFRATT